MDINRIEPGMWISVTYTAPRPSGLLGVNEYEVAKIEPDLNHATYSKVWVYADGSEGDVMFNRINDRYVWWFRPDEIKDIVRTIPKISFTITSDSLKQKGGKTKKLVRSKIN